MASRGEDDMRTIWCGNLSDEVTEELLYELFLQIAPLEKVKIPVDSKGKKYNYAFITFRHEQSIDYALQSLTGIRLFDKPLNLQPRNGNSQNKSDRHPAQFDNRNFHQGNNASDLLRSRQMNNLYRGNNMQQQQYYQEQESRYRDNQSPHRRGDYYASRNSSPNYRQRGYNDQRRHNRHF